MGMTTMVAHIQSRVVDASIEQIEIGKSFGKSTNGSSFAANFLTQQGVANGSSKDDMR